MTKIIERLSLIADKFDGVIVDQWGVMHDGRAPLPYARETLEQMKKVERTVVTLSNSSRTRKKTQALLEALGFQTPRHYDHIVTSGADMRDHFRDPLDSFYRALPPSARVFLLSSYDGDLSLLEDLPCRVVQSLEEADVLLVTGLRDGDSARDYDSILERAVQRSLPMICPNADRLVARPDGSLQECAGLIADLYRSKGGRVRLHGKPDAAVFHSCLRLGKIAEPQRWLAIGDSLPNDIKGAENANLGASLLVASGIHKRALLGTSGTLEESALRALIARTGIEPTYACQTLRW